MDISGWKLPGKKVAAGDKAAKNGEFYTVADVNITNVCQLLESVLQDQGGDKEATLDITTELTNIPKRTLKKWWKAYEEMSKPA